MCGPQEEKQQQMGILIKSQNITKIWYLLQLKDGILTMFENVMFMFAYASTYVIQ